MNRNFQKELERLIVNIEKKEEVPRLLIHSCCAPCSSYCLQYLSEYFEITVFYYNPNITEAAEYEHRVKEQKRLIEALTVPDGTHTVQAKHPIYFVEGRYEPKRFLEAVRGLEHIPEGGERCFACYRMRLEETAQMAQELGMDYFATTLTISPLKNAGKLNAIGEELSELYHVKHLPSDFKKKGGYQQSIALSKEYDLYRQDYCGCGFSKAEALARREGSVL